MRTANQKYTKAGIASHPTKEDKSPMFAGWKEGFDETYFDNAYGIGLVCGKKSNGLECLDFDNKFQDAKQILTNYIAIPEVKDIYERYKLPIEQSVSGGFHLLFRCDKNEGNRKLASRLNDKGRPEALIETRGEGGYFVASPTPGYTVIRNDIFEIQSISVIERAILIDNAISMNEYYPQIIRTEYESSDKPGDLYNQKSGIEDETRGILQTAGWVNVRADKWRRPGKKDGISASLSVVKGMLLFYCFSSNGFPFEGGKAYTPFQVLSLVNFNGNFSDAARSLPQPEKKIIETKGKLPESELEKILSGTKIDTGKKIDKPPTILSIREVSGTQLVEKRLFTLGNFSTIIGKAKSKKTYLLTIFVHYLCAKDISYNDKFVSSMTEDKNLVLWFDTEQGEYDSWNTIKRIERTAGNLDNLLAFNLRPFSPAERCQIIDFAMKKYGNKASFCIIDGIADLANAINDEDEATRVATLLLRMTKEHNIHVCIVLHQNKNDNYATGHLGSAMMKKSEIIISVTKDKKNSYVSDVNCDLIRGASNFEPFSFLINNEGLPEFFEKKREESKKRKKSFYETENIWDDENDVF